MLAQGLEDPHTQSVDSIALGCVSTHRGTRVSDRTKQLMSQQDEPYQENEGETEAWNGSLKDTPKT